MALLKMGMQNTPVYLVIMDYVLSQTIIVLNSKSVQDTNISSKI